MITFLTFPFPLVASLQRSLCLWRTCVDARHGWLWDVSVCRRLKPCLCPSLWKITSSTSESRTQALMTDTHREDAWGAPVTAPSGGWGKHVYIVAHCWNLRVLYLFVLVIFIFTLYDLFKLLMALEEARRTVLLTLNRTVCSGSPAPPCVRFALENMTGSCVSEAQ